MSAPPLSKAQFEALYGLSLSLTLAKSGADWAFVRGGRIVADSDVQKLHAAGYVDFWESNGSLDARITRNGSIVLARVLQQIARRCLKALEEYQRTKS
jgi:hypothetical protein